MLAALRLGDDVAQLAVGIGIGAPAFADGDHDFTAILVNILPRCASVFSFLC
jgi:hypothetical protein